VINRKSNLFQEPTEQELRAILTESLGPGEMEPPRLLEGGLFNTTYLISRTNPPGKYVLRMGPVNRHLILPFERKLMQAEQEACRLLALHDIPTSRVVACDTSRRVIDRDYMMVEYIPSIPILDNSVPEGEKDHLYEQVGRYTAQMHTITGPRFGRLADVANGDGYSTWYDFLQAETEQLEQACRPYGIFPQGEISQIMEILWKYRAFWGKVEIPRFVHMDLWDGNILVQPSPDGAGFQVAAIIDGDRALYGDPDYDFSSPWMSREAFFRGAGHEKIDPEKAMIYQMLIAASDAYICQVEYNNPEGSLDNREKVRDFIQKLR
jgi:aminoglycoside phosphotransferase (APT) family kinase protein